MPKPHPQPLHLRRIDAGRNMRRFYALSTQPTLFGEMSLIPNWVRIGTNGKIMVQTRGGRSSELERQAKARLSRSRRKAVTAGNFSGITALAVMPALSVPHP